MPERQNDQAQLLDLYVTALRLNQQAEAPAGLDPGLAAVARSIAGQASLARAGSAAAERVWQRLDTTNATQSDRQAWSPPASVTTSNGRMPSADDSPGTARPVLPRRSDSPVIDIGARRRRRSREIMQLVAELLILVAGAGLLVLLFGGSEQQVANPAGSPATVTASPELQQPVISDWRIEGADVGDSDLAGIGIGPDGTLYVADVANSRILHLRPDGSLITSFGGPGSGPGELSLGTEVRVSSIGVDAIGNVYVPDQRNGRIQIFSADGAYLTSWDASDAAGGGLNLPTGVAVDRESNVFVTDFVPESSSWRILKLDREGQTALTIDDDENIESLNNYISGIAVDQIGNVYVTDADFNRVLKFDSQGKFLLEWGGTGSEPGLFNAPHSLAIDAGGNVYVADAFNFRVQRFTTEGVYLDHWGNEAGSEIAFDRPISVDVDAGGAIYVVDLGNTLRKFHLAAP